MGRQGARERWQELVARQADSGWGIAEFCRRHNVSQASFFQWRRKLREAPRPSAAFVPLSIAQPAATAVRVELPCGAVLHLPPGDDRALTQVLGLLLDRSVAEPQR